MWWRKINKWYLFHDTIVLCLNVFLTMSPPENALKDAPPVEPLTALQTHLKFFDTDDDGVIYPVDTYLCFDILRISFQ